MGKGKIATGVGVFLFLVSSAIAPAPALSLSCATTALLAQLQIQPKDPIIIAEVLQLEADGSLRVKVSEVLYGNLEQKAIRLDSRSLVYWSFGSAAFPKRSQWVFQLYATDQAGYDFSLSPCLKPASVAGNQVSGHFTLEAGEETITLEELRKRIADRTQ